MTDKAPSTALREKLKHDITRGFGESPTPDDDIDLKAAQNEIGHVAVYVFAKWHSLMQDPWGSHLQQMRDNAILQLRVGIGDLQRDKFPNSFYVPKDRAEALLNKIEPLVRDGMRIDP